MLSVLMQVMVTFSLIVVLWCIYGYSLAFTEGNAFIGGFDRLFMKGIWDNAAGTFANAATFSKGVYIPEIVFAAFQATFAGITCCLIVGAFAERIKFSAVLAFMALWFTFSYRRSRTWSGSGWARTPTPARKWSTADEAAKAGLIWQTGARWTSPAAPWCTSTPRWPAWWAPIWSASASATARNPWHSAQPDADHGRCFAAVGGLVRLQRRLGAGSQRLSPRWPSSTPSAPPPPPCSAWCVGEALMRGKASMLGAASGAVAGLVAITPAAGNVGIGGALVIGFVAGFACLWGVNGLKHMLGADDSLDVFGVHGVGGIVGALLTGVFNSPALGGPGYVADWVTAGMVAAADYSIASQVWVQTKAVLTTIVWSGVVSFIAYKVVDLTIGLRVSEEDEREGLDITSHGETAYSR
jgi:Amt family ammonium transporter